MFKMKQYALIADKFATECSVGGKPLIITIEFLAYFDQNLLA